MDFGKFKFDQTIKEKKQKKKQQKQTQIKEIRLSPSIQDNDIETKANSAIKFLKSNQKVQVKLQFKRRELMHQGLGYNVINSFIEKLKDYGTAIGKPNSDGRNIFCTIEPKSE
jgi:translation initiation factor IF-3